jgi:hypothetical protein
MLRLNEAASAKSGIGSMVWSEFGVARDYITAHSVTSNDMDEQPDKTVRNPLDRENGKEGGGGLQPDCPIKAIFDATHTNIYLVT